MIERIQTNTNSIIIIITIHMATLMIRNIHTIPLDTHHQKLPLPLPLPVQLQLLLLPLPPQQPRLPHPHPLLHLRLHVPDHVQRKTTIATENIITDITNTVTGKKQINKRKNSSRRGNS